MSAARTSPYSGWYWAQGDAEFREAHLPGILHLGVQRTVCGQRRGRRVPRRSLSAVGACQACSLGWVRDAAYLRPQTILSTILPSRFGKATVGIIVQFSGGSK